MKILIFGSGGVGGYFGGRLQQAGHEVVFVARGAHAAAMRSQGLRIKSAVGDATLQVKVVEAPEAADYTILAVKLWDTESAAAAIAKASSEGAVVSLQNGVDKDEVLADAVGAERVFGGVAHIGTAIAEPGVIAHTGKLARITIGELSGGSSSNARPVAAEAASGRVERLAKALRDAGVETKVSDDMRRTTWEKFCFLTALSGLTSLTRKPIGIIRETAATRSMLIDALHEAAQVARAEGAALPATFEEQTLSQMDSLAPNMMSSMSIDLLRGSRLELPWLSGAVVRRAAKHGIAVPTHKAIEAALVLYQNGAETTR
jgi:2-dehydropantoate 2-reductase